MKNGFLFILMSISCSALAADMKVTIYRYWSPIENIRSKLVRVDDQDPAICTEFLKRLNMQKQQNTSHESFAVELTIKSDSVFDGSGKEVGNYVEKENRIRTIEEPLFPKSYLGVSYKQQSSFDNILSRSGDGLENQEESITIHTADGVKLLCTFVVQRMALVKTPY